MTRTRLAAAVAAVSLGFAAVAIPAHAAPILVDDGDGVRIQNQSSELYLAAGPYSNGRALAIQVAEDAEVAGQEADEFNIRAADPYTDTWQYIYNVSASTDTGLRLCLTAPSNAANNVQATFETCDLGVPSGTNKAARQQWAVDQLEAADDRAPGVEIGDNRAFRSLILNNSNASTGSGTDISLYRDVDAATQVFTILD